MFECRSECRHFSRQRLLKMINIKKKIASEKEKKATNPSPLGRRPSVRSQLLTKGVSNFMCTCVIVNLLKLVELPELQRNLPSKRKTNVS